MAPNGVGVDIGCGMAAVPVRGLTLRDLLARKDWEGYAGPASGRAGAEDRDVDSMSSEQGLLRHFAPELLALQ